MGHIMSKKDDPFYKFNQLYKVSERGCWEWLGYKTRKGYGTQRFGGKKILAHRYSYELYNGKIPDGLCICHKCDNPSCVNPDHLFLGTIQENNLDCIKKGRIARGEKRGSKLKEEDIKLIRNLYNTYKIYHKQIATMFGVSRTSITLILNNKRWSHV